MALDMMRIVLFLVTNIAVMVVISILFSVFGVGQVLDANGVDLDLGKLLIYSALFGFGGSIISLLVSKWMAKRATGAHVIETPRNEAEQWLLGTVRRQAQAAGIGMPEVAIYDAPEINAFATGANRNNALVAVSTGLLRAMSRDEAEAVLAHEVSHVANGDMVTMALLQGVLNTFVIVLSRVVGHIVDRVILKNERGHGMGYMLSSLVAQILLGILASMIVSWFSRRREFRADAGGAQYAGTENMVAALERLKGGTAPMPDGMAAFGIGGGGIWELFSTHPPLDKRIAALRANRG
jgi:heat shock protein HtpX